VLVVGPNPEPFREIRQWAETSGAFVERAPDMAGASRCIACAAWDLVVPLLDGSPEDALQTWVDRVGAMRGGPRLLPIAKDGSLALAMRAAELGVPDVLSVPVDLPHLCVALDRLRKAADERPIQLPVARPVRIGSQALVGQSQAMVKVYKTIAQAAPSTATVLLVGETGTGKELAARAIHQLSSRADQPLVTVNCAAIPENLLESELFGHEKGAFTGAVSRKVGRFERANGGTFFLDEIADMSLSLQAKILRAIQEREIERVGGRESVPVDVRLIAATNRDLREAIAKGRFREDLYYRLAVVTIRLPALAERGDDLLHLARHFIEEAARRHNRQVMAISDRALHLLCEHSWAGNVRELQNVIERAVLVADGDLIRSEHLPEEWERSGQRVVGPADEPLWTLREMESRHIVRALAHTRGELLAASRILGIHRNTLARKVREYNL